MSEVRYATFDPTSFVQGGLLDDADVRIADAGFQVWNYNGGGKDTTALRVAFEDAEGKTHEQFYSVGDPERFSPSDDGSKILLTGTATSINAGSNFAQFVKSLIDAGVPVSFFQTDDIKKLVDLRIHVNRVNQKERAGINNTRDNGQARTILLATKLISLPGQKPAGGGATKAAATKTGATKTSAPAAAPAVEVSEELADKVVRYLSTVAGEQGGSVPRAKVSTLVFQAAMKAKDAAKQDVMKLAFDESFLTANSGRPVTEGDEVFAFEYDSAAKVINKAA